MNAFDHYPAKLEQVGILSGAGVHQVSVQRVGRLQGVDLEADLVHQISQHSAFAGPRHM
jgi:hypothetical protein